MGAIIGAALGAGAALGETRFDGWDRLPTPCYVVDEGLIEKNLALLRQTADAAGCKILLAQKGFSMFALYPLVARYLDGAASSSLCEARLAREEMGKEVHVYAPAYRDDEFDALLECCDHVVFNSFHQWRRFRDRAQASQAHKASGLEFGIRVNPEHSESQTPIYDPCAPHSRLGVTLSEFEPGALEGIDGIHFHTLCEQDADALVRTVDVFCEKFGAAMRAHAFKWANFGGGHHITRPGYDIDALVRRVRAFRERHGLNVYLEPGEAIALNAGFLVATVLDVMRNGMDIAILDASAACHMPDVLEMPYRPAIVGAGLPGERARTYRLGGPTCLAGDVIGDYSFDRALEPGDRLVFCDMAHYSMVKNNTFNGIALPAIALSGGARAPRADASELGDAGNARVIRRFGYEDFKSRLS